MKPIKVLFFFSFIGLMGASWPLNWMINHPNSEVFGSNSWIEKEVRIIQSETSGLNPKVLRLSLKAYVKAHKNGLVDKDLLTIIDYSKPSTEKRLWVFDVKHGRELFYTWVSHGKNTGGVNATSFSNSPGSLKSSLGVFVTDTTPYMGGNGYSLRMHGLEAGINDKAYDRDIVFHGAWYVNPATIKRYGQIGRSWGCPAVSDGLAKSIIDTIKSRTVVIAYYPDRHWLTHSKFITG